MGLGHLVEDACLGSRVTELASTVNFSSVLPIQLASQMLDQRLQGRDARVAKGRLFLRTRRVVRHDQAVTFPLRFGDHLVVLAGRRIVKRLHELTVPPPRHSQDKLQKLNNGQGKAPFCPKASQKILAAGALGFAIGYRK